MSALDAVIQGMRSRIPASPIDAKDIRSLSLNNICSSASGLLSLTTKSKIPRPPAPLTCERPEQQIQKMSRAHKPNIVAQLPDALIDVQETKPKPSTIARKKKKKTLTTQTKLKSNLTSMERAPVVKQVIVSASTSAVRQKARILHGSLNHEGLHKDNGLELVGPLTDGGCRRTSLIKKAKKEVPNRQHLSKVQHKNDRMDEERKQQRLKSQKLSSSSHERSRSSMTATDLTKKKKKEKQSTSLRRKSAQDLDDKDLSRKTDYTSSFQESQKSFPKQMAHEKTIPTPRPVVTVMVHATPTNSPTPTVEPKEEISLWKRIKKMSSVKIMSGWKGDQSRDAATRLAAVAQSDNRDCFMSKRIVQPKSKSRRVKEGSLVVEEQLSHTLHESMDSSVAYSNGQSVSTKDSILAQEDTASTTEPMSAKNDPHEQPPVTPTTLSSNFDVQNVEEEFSSLFHTRLSTVPSSALTNSQVISQEAEVRGSEGEGEDLLQSLSLAKTLEEENETPKHCYWGTSTPNPPPFAPFESCFTKFSEQTEAPEMLSSAAIMNTACGETSCSKSITPRRISVDPALSESPDFNSNPRVEKFARSQKYSTLHLPNFSSVENNFDYLGLPSGRSPLRKMDSARIGAQCELIRDTIKEESRRVLSMTSLLEAMNSAPTQPAQVNMEAAQNRELHKKQTEKMNDLEMENQHLRQLLEFSIGSMRKQKWMLGSTPEIMQSFGPAFNNPIPVLEDADSELISRSHSKTRQTKLIKGKRSKADKEQIARLQQALESKDVLLKVITESYCQITSMQSWYEKRIEDLAKDRERVQAERSQCIKELSGLGIINQEEFDAHCQRAEVFRQMENC